MPNGPRPMPPRWPSRAWSTTRSSGRDDASVMSPSSNTPALAGFSGTILLVGAGKMGSAMLEGWLALGLAADKVAVLEPQPVSEIAALTARGLRLNPPREALGQ